MCPSPFFGCRLPYSPAIGWRSDDDEGPTKQQQKVAGAKVARLKAQLKTMLAQPLIARGVSTRYITSGVRSIADEMIAGECALFSLSLFLFEGLFFPTENHSFSVAFLAK